MESPLIKERARSRTFQKLSRQGVTKILLERGDNPEKEEVHKEMGVRGAATYLLLYSSIAFAVWGKSKVSFITF